jgi:hypothetical protein
MNNQLYLLGGLGVLLPIMSGLIGLDGGQVVMMGVIIHRDGDILLLILILMELPDPGVELDDTLILADIIPLEDIPLEDIPLEVDIHVKLLSLFNRMKNKSAFVLTFLLVSIIIGLLLYVLFRKSEKVIIYRERPEIIVPVRSMVERPWWDFGGVPMKPTTPSTPPGSSSPPPPSKS